MPPTGTVAFLFTDVEASTRRWERYGEAMRAALRRHDTILRCAIEEHRGYVFKTIGDAFCAAFETADDALNAAVEAQRRLAQEDFGAVDGLHVRMAIGAGEADERDGDYFGSALNRTARLLGAGHGGQILLSGEAADLALPKLSRDVTLRHLGSLPLRDVKEPERVYQPVGPGLRSAFKALRALETPPNNLPRQTTTFVGRHEDLARIEALLDEASLITIVGAGGIGKTRLALEVASARINDKRDGAWFVDLSSVGDARLIPGTILATLMGERSTAVESLDDLLAFVEKRELLLVLDNSEHLVSDVAPIAAQITARSPHVAVLATSRSPLDVSGEIVYRLSALDPATAAQLFSDRARAANPALHLDTSSAIVEQICSRLDGIALAIELAAARVRTMSAESLASHLELRLLRGGRDRRPRQQTMRALIDWSYDLLGEQERRILRRASVFMRGFTLSLAAEVCADEAEEQWRVLDLLASLVDKSLVVAESQHADQRYRILEPIREYAWEKLGAAGETPRTQRLHAVAIESLAASWYAQWDEGPPPEWLAMLERDLANLRAALRWSAGEGHDRELGARLVAHATIVFLRLGLLNEGMEWCNRMLEAGPALSPEVEARLRYGLSMLYSNLGSESKCLEQAHVAVALYRQTEDSRGIARALSQVASRYATAQRWAEAEAVAREALQRARESGDRRLVADVLRRCAQAFAAQGEQCVRERYAQSVALFRALGRNDDTSRALQWWGQWENTVGCYNEAADRLLEAADLNERDTWQMFVVNDIASCYLAAGDRERAEPFARRALTLATKARHEILGSLAISFLAVIGSARDARTAARLLGHAQERLRAAGWNLQPPDDATIASLRAALELELERDDLGRLLSEGAAYSEERAVADALAL